MVPETRPHRLSLRAYHAERLSGAGLAVGEQADVVALPGRRQTVEPEVVEYGLLRGEARVARIVGPVAEVEGEILDFPGLWVGNCGAIAVHLNAAF